MRARRGVFVFTPRPPFLSPLPWSARADFALACAHTCRRCVHACGGCSPLLCRPPSPFCTRPRFEKFVGSEQGDHLARQYNENAFLLTMQVR